MSASRQPITEGDAARWSADGDLHLRVMRDMIARPDDYGDVPRGSTLILVPDEDPVQAEWAIRQCSSVLTRQ